MEEQNKLDNFFNISFDPKSSAGLRTVAKWSMVAAICSVCGSLLGVVLAILGKNRTEESSGLISYAFFSTANVAGSIVVLILSAAFNYFLYSFSVNTLKGLTNLDPGKLNEGLSSLKTYYKILGIIMIVAMGIVLIGFFYILIMYGTRTRN
jgi:hypothetical protein